MFLLCKLYGERVKIKLMRNSSAVCLFTAVKHEMTFLYVVVLYVCILYVREKEQIPNVASSPIRFYT